MAMHDVAAAMRRVETVLRRRPDMGLHDDAPATALWQGGTRVVASHANGTTMSTDMPDELGGSGDQVTPGWLFRAGIASCLTTTIAMAAAAEGIELTTLEVRAGSRSDTRGLLRMTGADGETVSARPQEMRLQVSISARGVLPGRLRALVEACRHCSPIPNAVENIVPLDLCIEAT
jgi:organic hydroperoxide reductase OsmC/OhrA